MRSDVNAEMSRNVQIVRLLIHQGAEVSPKNHLGGSPLHAASRKNFVNVAWQLCEHGADVSASDSFCPLGGKPSTLNPQPLTLNP